MINTSSKDYTVVIHDTPNPPRFFKVNKNVLKITFALIIASTFLSILFSLAYTTYIQNKVERSKNTVPKEILLLKEQLKKVNLKLKEEVKLTKDLQYKISNTSKDESNINSLIPLPLGFKDLRTLTNASVENITTNTQKNKTILKFDIFNNTKEGVRLSGYIYVFKLSTGTIQSYPKQGYDGYQLTNGESFVISKFRPTRIVFNKSNEKSLYKIFVFSRTGDLLDYKEHRE